MLDFISSYSLSEILIFFIMAAVCIKELITFIDWVIDRLNKQYNKHYNQNKDKDTIHNQIQELNDCIKQEQKQQNKRQEEINIQFNKVNKDIKSLSDSVNLLLNSDRDDIKSYIVEKHHYFCYDKQWIDDYSLECLEKRYSHYEEEGGNSFIKNLMEEIRELSRTPIK